MSETTTKAADKSRKRLCQVVAAEKQLKGRVNSEGAELHKSNQKADLYNGLTRNYEKLNDSDETLPSENKKVQMIAEDNLKAWGSLLGEFLGVALTKENGNASASARVASLNADLPVSYLVWLEKQLNDHRTFVSNMPVLSGDRDWKKSSTTGLYETDPVRTVRGKKIPKVITKAAATEHHPAQAEILGEDVTVGHWVTVSLSGAISATRRRELLDRVDRLILEVKEAREEANSHKIDDYTEVGRSITALLTK